MELKEYLQIIAYLATTLSAITAIVAAILITRQISNIRRNREVDTLLKVIALSDAEATREAKEWMMYELDESITFQQLKSNKDYTAKFSQLIHLFETMGVLVSRQYIPKELLFDKYGLLIIGAWWKLHGHIMGFRASYQSKEYAENFEYLVDEYNNWARQVPLKVAKGERVMLKEATNFLNRKKELP